MVSLSRRSRPSEVDLKIQELEALVGKWPPFTDDPVDERAFFDQTILCLKGLISRLGELAG
jgi:hypothetical protein